MSSQRRIMVVSWPILPNRGGSVIIIEKLMKHFSGDEAVLFGELPPLGRAPKRDQSRPRAHYFRSGLSLFGRGARFFAAIRWLMFPLLVRKLCRTIQKENCDYVLAVYPDEYYCYAASVAAKNLGLPFSVYFHNTYIDNEAVDAKRGRRIQPILFEQAEFVFVISDGLKRFYEEKYSLANVVTLVHTFDEFPPPVEVNSLADKDDVSLVLIGNFNHSNIEATKRLVDAVSKNGRFKIYVYTHVPPALLKMRGIDPSQIQHMGYIDDASLISELRKYDIAVLTHGFDGGYGPIEYRTIFPTRTIPMLLCGRPMLVHSPPESFLTEFTREHRFGLLVDQRSEEKLIDGLNRIVGDHEYSRSLVLAAQEVADKYHGPNVAKVLRSTLGMHKS